MPDLLLAADGLSNTEIGMILNMHRNAISNIRNRFAQIGMACVEDAPRVGKPPVHTSQTKQNIVTIVCGNPPKRMSRWSNDYVHHGTQTMPAAIEIESGKAMTWVNKTRKAEDFVSFMNRIVR